MARNPPCTASGSMRCPSRVPFPDGRGWLRTGLSGTTGTTGTRRASPASRSCVGRRASPEPNLPAPGTTFTRLWLDGILPARAGYKETTVPQPVGDADPFAGMGEPGCASLDDLEERMYDSEAGRATVA